MLQGWMIERLGAEDQRTVRRQLPRVIGTYGLLIAMLLAGATIRLAVVEPNEVHATGLLGVLPGATVTSDAAAEPDPAACARRDRVAVGAIAQHGDARDVPSAALTEAFYTVLSARAACATGAVDQAVALYDGIRFTADVPTD